MDKPPTQKQFLDLFGDRYSCPAKDRLKNIRACKVMLVERTFYTWTLSLGPNDNGVGVQEALSTPLECPFWWCPIEFTGRWWETDVKLAPWMDDGVELVDPYDWADRAGRQHRLDAHLPADHPRRGVRALLQNTRSIAGEPVDEEKCRLVKTLLEGIFRKLDGNEDWSTWGSVELALIAGMTRPMALRSFTTSAESLLQTRKLAENMIASRGSKREWTMEAEKLLLRDSTTSARAVAEHLKNLGVCSYDEWGDDIEFYGERAETKKKSSFETAVSTLKKRLREKS